MLLTPGPVEVPQEFFEQKLLHHRSKEFAEFYRGIVETLKRISGYEEVVILTGSGTLANEAMMSNFPSQKFLSLSNGEFGDRLANLAGLYGKTETIRFNDGEGVNAGKIQQDLNNYEAITIVENETSTAVMNDVPSLRKNFNGLILADAVSSWPVGRMGAAPDAFTTASQKALGIMPGLSFVFLNKRAVELLGDYRGEYMNLKAYIEKYKKLQTPFTPAVTLLFSLKKSLDRIEETGLAAYRKKHERTAELVRKRIKELGFELTAEAGFESPTVTGFLCESEEEKNRIREGLKKEGFEIAGGKGQFKERGLRLAHMGFFDEETIREALEKLAELA